MSLVTPKDKTSEWKPNPSIPPLNDEEFEAAKNVQSIPLFPKIDRAYADPAVEGQRFVLFSFVPSKGASPDKDGIYGFAKVRGSYNTIKETEYASENLIRYTDSDNKIYTTFVGKPFPVTLEEKFSEKVNEINLQEKAEDVIETDKAKKEAEENKQMKEIKEREQKLMKESKTEVYSPDPLEKYTTARTKKAQLIYTYYQTISRIEKEIIPAIKRVRKELKEMDEEDSTLRDQYMDIYHKSREDAGITNDNVSPFMKYMEDVELDEVDFSKLVIA